MAPPQSASVSLEHTEKQFDQQEYSSRKYLGSVELSKNNNGLFKITEGFVLDRQVGALLAGTPALLA